MSRTFKYLILLAALSAAWKFSYAQQEEPLYREYTTLDGLSSNEVYDVICDRKGFLWFATNKGVSRYDGRSFRVFNSDHGLGDNSVLGLFEDYQGRIWCRTISGVISYVKNDSVFTIQARTKISYPNSIYVGTDDVVRVGCHEQGVMYVIAPPYHESNIVIERDTEHDLKVMRFQDGFCFSRSGYSNFSLLKMATGASYELKSVVSSAASKVVCRDEFVAISSGTHLTVAKSGSVVNELEMSEEIANVSFDNDGLIWICYANSLGVTRINPTNSQSENFSMLQGHAVSDVLTDPEGGYWFATVNEGVFYASDLQIIRLNTESALSGNINLFGDQQSVLLTDYERSALIFDESGTKEIKLSDWINNPHGIDIGLFPILKGTTFTYIDDTDRVSVKPTNSFIRIYESADLLKDSANGKVYGAMPLLCFEAGLKDHNILQSFRPPSRINAFCASGDSLFLGCIDGVYSFRHGQFRKLFLDSKELNTRIDDIRIGRSGELWIATSNQGMVMMRNGRLKTIRKEDGLSSNICNRIRLTPQGLLVASNEGLDLIELDDHDEVKVENLALIFGLQGRAFNDFVVQQDGVVVQTELGVLRLKLSAEMKRSVVPKIFLTGVMVEGVDYLSKSGFELSPNRYEISFHFVSPVYRNSSSLTYRYRLNGADNDWHYTAYPIAQYPSLSPGEYQFVVQAVLPNGMMSENPATYSLIILKPVWMHWWFLILVLLLFCSLVIFIVFVRIRNIKRKAEEREKIQLRISAVEMKALRAQMNPHFIFNCINSIQSFILNNEKLEAQKQLTRFSKLVRNVLENSDTDWITVDREMETLKLYLELESMRFNSSFTFMIEIDDSVNKHADQIPPMAIQPFVENAIVHGLVSLKDTHGLLKIHLSRQGDNIFCRIDDNGIGRERAREIKSRKHHGQRSMGIELTKERLLRYHQSNPQDGTPVVVISDKYDNQQKPTGTLVILKLPIQILKR